METRDVGKGKNCFRFIARESLKRSWCGPDKVDFEQSSWVVF
jgi:hypothetical protein